jgi:hypothetical protein
LPTIKPETNKVMLPQLNQNNSFISLIYGLFNDTVSTSDHTASNGRMDIGLQTLQKEVVMV